MFYLNFSLFILSEIDYSPLPKGSGKAASAEIPKEEGEFSAVQAEPPKVENSPELSCAVSKWMTSGFDDHAVDMN